MPSSWVLTTPTCGSPPRSWLSTRKIWPRPASISIVASTGIKTTGPSTRWPPGLSLWKTTRNEPRPSFGEGIAAAKENESLQFLLTEVLIDQGKLEGNEGAIAWTDRLDKLGLREGYADFLSARVSMAKHDWEGATKKFEVIRSLLANDHAFVARVDFLLAECYGRTGEPTRKTAALEHGA